MDIDRAKQEFPMWSRQEPLRIEDMLPSHKREAKYDRFLKRYGITVVIGCAWAASMILGCCVTGTIVKRNTEREVTEQVTQEMLGNMHRYAEQQEQERIARGLLTGDASLQEAMSREADAIARAVGTMATKRQKLSMCWNILVRVDNPAYPNSVEEVVNQPQQWMFYSEENPIRDDDRELVLEQLKLWHEGRYPAGLSTEMVFAEWSQNDYVLRDTWEKSSSSTYWRFPE